MAALTDETAMRTEDFDEEDDEHGSKEKVLQKYFLQEWELVKSLLDDIVSRRGVPNPSVAHKIRSIMDKYQEQGQLIEPYLESIVSPLMFIVRSKTIELGVASGKILEVIKPICIIIYSLVTVCGYKAVIRFFPHQVSDLELAVSLLEKCHRKNAMTSSRHESTGEMEAKCVMLLWLLILVLIPFDLSTVDTSIASSADLGDDEIAPLVLKIVGFSKDYLSSAGPMRTLAALLLSKLLTRPDMPVAFSSFVDWTHEVLLSATEDIVNHFLLLGAVEALAAIFKGGGKKLLGDAIPKVWGDSSALIKSGTASRSPLLRKYLMKLTQRIGFTCLPHSFPSWRYVSKTSLLGENMLIAGPRETDKLGNNVNLGGCNYEEKSSFPEDEEMDVPEIVEEIIEMLLTGLRDTDTVVRWSAAKGIGRITSRLTSSLSEEVLSSVLELFSPTEGDGSWHGGCLSLAELARRGLLLPMSLPKVVPVVVKALHYDIRRGPHSVGSYVRDAAAYVCWAFGRAYYQSDMKNILDQLAPHLLTVACYDREVNCRRAAAAAFQENVGRQGNYPHGIDIVNTADYFSLSSRVNSYMHVAVYIAQFEGYLYPFAEELLYNKICHWEKGLRELAAEALSALAKYEPAYFADFVLEKLIPCTLSSDLCMRHGATLAVGELVLALHHCGFSLSSDKQKHVAGIVPAIEKARLYRGKGGEIMRLAVSRFIECIALISLPLTERIKRTLLDTLNDNLKHPNSQIQDAAVKAFKHFVLAYTVAAGTGDTSDIASKYLDLLTDQNVAVRRGSALAIGVLPPELLARKWKDYLMKLSQCCQIEENPDDRDAEARVNSVKGLVSVCEILTREQRNGVDDTDLMPLIKNEVMGSLLKALDDYSVDNRGDVGSWVREAAMEGLERCSFILCKRDSELQKTDGIENNELSSLFDANLATDIIRGICKQAVEKMDKLRESAAKILRRVLFSNVVYIPPIPHRKELEEILQEKSDLKWAVPAFSYTRFVQLLQFSCYSRSVLSGLVIAIGGLQESLKKASLSALLRYLEGAKIENRDESKSREYSLSTDMLWVLQKYRRSNRVIIPTLKTIEILFSHKKFLDMEAQTTTFCAGVLDSLTIELKVSKDFSKLYAGIAILGYIASTLDREINAPAFSRLLGFLCHRYPKIRKASAEQVYLVLLQNENLVDDDKIEKALEIVTETCWDGDMEASEPQRLELYSMAGVDAEVGRKAGGLPKKSTELKSDAADENASYSSLVESSGF